MYKSLFHTITYLPSKYIFNFLLNQLDVFLRIEEVAHKQFGVEVKSNRRRKFDNKGVSKIQQGDTE